MRLSELKEILEKDAEKSRSYYRQYPSLHRDVVLWQDYLAMVETYRRKGVHRAKERARIAVLDVWIIGENTFYKIHRLLRDLCEDVT